MLFGMEGVPQHTIPLQRRADRAVEAVDNRAIRHTHSLGDGWAWRLRLGLGGARRLDNIIGRRAGLPIQSLRPQGGSWA